MNNPAIPKETPALARSSAEDLAKAGVSLGIAGLFIEVHPNPEQALCDGPSATPLHEFESLLEKVNAVDQAVKGL